MLIRPSRFVAIAVAQLAVAFSALHAQSPKAVAASARVQATADFSARTQLANHVPVFADTTKLASQPLQANEQFARLTIVLSRAPEVQAAFDQLLQDQLNPSSPRYHQWLQPQQVGELYGPAQSDIDAVESWLKGQGLTVLDVSSNHLFIDFAGPAETVASAFNTSFRRFSLANGETRYSLMNEPSVPAALAPVISNIVGLSQIIHKPMVHKSALIPASTDALGNLKPAYTSTSSGSHYMVSGDFNKMYDVTGAINAGITGAGQNIAIAGGSRVDNTDITKLESIEGATQRLPNVIIPSTGTDPGYTGGNSYCNASITTCNDSGAQDEATLDVDRTIATAPGATIDLVVSADNTKGTTLGTYDGFYISILYEINTLNDPILSVSYGGCEVLNGQSNDIYLNSIFSTAASQGISVFISSGDSGAAECNAFSTTTPIPSNQYLSISDNCSTQYITCVGGTEPADSTNASSYWGSNDSTNTSILGYIPEGAWNDVSLDTNGNENQGATGGGVSIYMPKASWQTGTGVPSGSYRWTPDVSLQASTHDGFVTCLEYLGANCGGFYSFGGTSASAPSMAAIQAMVNQKLGGRQGNMNPKIYALAATANYATAFHDTTVASSGVSGCSVSTPSLCNNSTPGVKTTTGGLAGYNVTTGWDASTGWGSVDAYNYILALAATTVTSTATIVTATPNPTTTGTTVTLKASISPNTSGANTAGGNVQFSYSLNGGASVNIGTAIGLASGAASTTTSFSTAGSYVITASYTGDSNFSASAGTTTVAVSSSGFTITPASLALPTSGTITGGTAVTDGLTITSTNSFVGTATLTCTVTPSTAGTCSVSPTPVTLAANGSTTSTLTITPTVGYVGSLSVVVTGTSGSTVVVSSAIGVTVSAPFTISATPTAVSVIAGVTTGTSTVKFTSNGYAGTFTPQCTTATGLTCTFSPATVTLTSGGSATTTVTLGLASGTTSAVTATITSSVYTPTTATTIVVTPVSAFTVSASPSSLTFTSGATTGNTDTISVTAASGFSGAVSLSCSLSTGTAAYQPSCAIAPTSVTLTSGGTATATATISSTTSVTSAQKQPVTAGTTWRLAALATMLLAAFGLRRRRALGGVVMLAALALGSSLMSGCSGSTSTVRTTKSSAGTYVATVTATATVGTSSTTQTAVFTVNIQ